jgi:phage gpG-like protein
MAKTFIQRSRDKGAAEKAAFHQVTGAGKSRVKREFFGLSDADEDAIVTIVERHLDRELEP